MSQNHKPNEYAVWKLRFHLAMQDPETNTGTRYHTTIFVETNADKSGFAHHVVGDVTSGMTYQRKSCDQPERDSGFYSKEFLGYTKAVTHPKQWDDLLSTIPPPARQKAFNMKTIKTEQVKTWEPIVFYEPGEPHRQLVKCTEWTEQRAIPALEQAGLVVCVPLISAPKVAQSSSGSG